MSDLIKDWTSLEIDRIANSFRRYRVFIKSLKFVLPIIAIGLGIALVVYPTLYPEQKKFVIEPVETIDETDVPAMVNPKFGGYDKENQPYSFTAARAYPQDDKTVLLQDIVADITLKNGTFASIVTPMGFYSSEQKKLELDDIFEIFITDNKAKSYQITGKKLDVNLTTLIIKSDQKVHAQTPMGTLDASAFTLYKAEGKISFKGPVKLVIKK